MAAATALALLPHLIGTGTLAATALLIVPYAMLQVVVLERYLARRVEPGRIDGLMAMALTYILWFVAIPLWGLV